MMDIPVNQNIPADRFSHVPERIYGLVELAYNLWWSWHSSAAGLFKQLNRAEWKNCRQNPVKMLLEIPPRFLERAAEDPDYLRRYDLLFFRFRHDMDRRNSWFSENYPERMPLTIAYFSSEFGVHHSLPLYAGGLGILAGDHIKESSDLGVPMVAVGFLYAEGYAHQHLQADGWQKNVVEVFNRDSAPITRVMDENGKHLVVQVPIIEPPIYVAVWKVQVGKVPLILLDTHIDENLPENRSISHRLYEHDLEMRLRQELVLGIGGRKVLSVLGIEYSAMHLNEGHSAFALLERLRERVSSGMSFEEAKEQVRNTSIFTTHTPVPAGHDVFPFDLMDRYFRNYAPSLGIDWDTFLGFGRSAHAPEAGFNMAAFALRMTRHHNGVSAKHGEVARRMWQGLWPGTPVEQVPIDHITNGVHIPTWLNPWMEALFDKYLDPVYPTWREDYDNRLIWNLIDEIPDKELWDLHLWLKVKFFARIRERKRLKWAEFRNEPRNLVSEGLLLDANVLTIGFARRFAEYKRADLIFEDFERLESIVTDRWRPVQFVFAGKAHPVDDFGKEILRRIYKFAGLPDFAGRIAFVENYGEEVAHHLVQGVDIWLNNPVPLMEASGTSGMKAAINGVPNLSILDGWWVEGYNGRNGWAFEGHQPYGKNRMADANTIYDIIEKQVAPLYYTRSMDEVPLGWVKVMKESIKSCVWQYSARRMVKEYITRYYPSVCMYAGEPTTGVVQVCRP
ncbi:alpha-glucan family phosphorylase [Methanoculleus frigidifontis]|nr:alpha-glucan family phosphorylase [Methanoculleus sp. FWC-SCC1]